LIFFTDYLYHILLSGHNESFNKHVKKNCLQKLPTSALTGYCYSKHIQKLKDKKIHKRLKQSRHSLMGQDPKMYGWSILIGSWTARKYCSIARYKYSANEHIIFHSYSNTAK